MYVIREILHCQPGKVRPLLEKFRVLSSALQELGHEPLRLLTDVAGEHFWTLIVEVKVEQVEQFFEVEKQLMGNEKVRHAMSDYHELVADGGREIYRVEN